MLGVLNIFSTINVQQIEGDQNKNSKEHFSDLISDLENELCEWRLAGSEVFKTLALALLYQGKTGQNMILEGLISFNLQADFRFINV